MFSTKREKELLKEKLLLYLESINQLAHNYYKKEGKFSLTLRRRSSVYLVRV